ncbi:hypothetical protein Tco_0773045, partial [Tanacetum coccineum]
SYFKRLLLRSFSYLVLLICNVTLPDTHYSAATQFGGVTRDVKFKENETWDWKDYIGEHTNGEPEWTNFNIGDPEVTNEHPDQETQSNEDDNEFPDNNDDDDYASPTRDSPSHS